jgi:hypothetical protein
MAWSNSAAASSGCQSIVDAHLDDSLHQAPEDPVARLCIWPSCHTSANTLAGLEAHAVDRHGCLPPRRITKSWAQQLPLFDPAQYGGCFTSLFRRLPMEL